ncbi:ABC transporter permease [Fundicoccus culcitae]|uniref:ABC transporter permease subunit n=1 Tax=Fundicoccus culcitae TaxID=2969821 RepID=A0ABY5P9N2_9LACT|nr:ABC transporter permease subunit [Fundicoccus culcitae]UUX35469.1 ABC transporter permease subunit [Fundicoccus culcitae]
MTSNKEKKEFRAKERKTKVKFIKQNWQLYLFLFPTLLYFVIFHYAPMYGILMAFKDYSPALGIWKSPWVGFMWFEDFFNSYYFTDLLKNTLGISIYQIIVGFPAPIILALLMNEVKDGLYKRGLQTITYAPHFISLVVMVGIIIAFLSPTTGLINNILGLFGIGPIPFMIQPKWFKTIYVFSGVWQSTGWGAIIYIAALSGVDPQLHEAAIMDGASRLQRIRHINIPAIVPIIVVMFILEMGGIMSVGFQKVLLMQNELNMSSSDVISTFVYRTGLLDAQYSYSTAVGLFDSVINATLLLTVNQISKKITQIGLW